MLALEAAPPAAPRGGSARSTIASSSAVGQDELERDELVELQVARGDDDAHAAGAEHPLDPVLAGEDVPLGDRR